MKNEMDMIAENTFEGLYLKLRSDNGLMTVMTQMQGSYGISERKAYENAEAMIRMVAQREELCEMLSEDAMEVLNSFLHESAKMSGYDRKVLLHQLSFGLKLYQDDELLERMKEGEFASKLFDEYYTLHGEDPAITEQLLEEKIRKQMSAYRISPKAMRYIAKNMEENQNMLASAVALGKEGQRFKCVMAMDMYLRNQKTMTMEEAVNTACTDIELEAVADAVACGRITEEKAKMIIMVTAMAAILLGIAIGIGMYFVPGTVGTVVTNAGWAAANYGAHPVAANAVKTGAVTVMQQMRNLKHSLLVGGLLWGGVSDNLSAWLGKLAAKRSFVRSIKESKAAQALHTMADHEEAEAEAAAEAAQTVRKEAVLEETVKKVEKAPAFG